MAISNRDRKLLWARSGNRCAFPGCRQHITQDAETGDSAFPVGEEAHIVARTPGGPRGNHPLPLDERDSYDNLILLCPTHHTIIDNDPETYTVEKLRQMKKDHELWVREVLAGGPVYPHSAAPPLPREESLGLRSVPTPASKLRYDVFLSYKSEDEEWVRELKQALVDRGLRVWLDRDEIRPGDLWPQALEDAIDSSRTVVMVVSPEALRSQWVRNEYYHAVALGQATNRSVRIIPVLLRNTELPGFLRMRQYVDFTDEGLFWDNVAALYWGITGVRPPSLERRAATPSVAPGEPALVSLARLPFTALDLFGREEQLKALDHAWEDRHTHLVALIGLGGVGKSAIVNRWLREMEKDDYRGARRVFGWSFYSQGQRETPVSADQFIHEALRFFGDPDPEEGNAWQRAERLARLIRKQPTILVVDGLEPIQSHDPGDLGKIKDPALQTLLCELFRGTNGLCVITSRLEPTDIALSDDGGPARRIDLSDLTAEAGVQLLRAAGVKGPEDELRQAVEDFKGHALALVLLAEYLVVFCGGDISRRSEVPLMDRELAQGGHAWRVMQAYDLAFKRDGAERERAILRIIGLFDRPAAGPYVDAVRAEPAIPGVTDAVVGLSNAEWRDCVAHLRRLRLISPAPTGEETLDAHPLVREYFGRKLQEESEEGFRQAHGRLYEYLRDHGKPTPDTDTDTLKDLLPLYQAVHHGCRGGRHQEAFDEVLWQRIQRRHAGFHVHKLGAFGAALAALAGFFKQRWTRPVAGLTDPARSWVLNEVGFALRALGRLDEAVAPLRSGLEEARDEGDFRNAAQGATNLAELLLAAGRLDEAGFTAEQGVGLADRSGDVFQRLTTLTDKATVAHAQGRLADATRDFEEAERIQKDYSPEYPLFYSVRGAQYCWLLLDLGRFAGAHFRASAALPLVTQQKWLLDIGLDHLSLGRASHLLALAAGNEEVERLGAEARAHLDAAVDTLRRAGQQDEVPRGLLSRAAFHRDFGERDEAERDLTEALTLAERIGLRLQETDACILQGHMALDGDSPDTEAAEKALDRAGKLVAETGYHLRDADLLLLEGRLLAKRDDTDPARAKLEEATKVAHREEGEGCVYQLAVDEANRYLKELEGQ